MRSLDIGERILKGSRSASQSGCCQGVWQGWNVVISEGRVLRVQYCHGCGWQYGAMWELKEKHSYWGDCPRCGHSTLLRDHYELGVREGLKRGEQLEVVYDAV